MLKSGAQALNRAQSVAAQSVAAERRRRQKRLTACPTRHYRLHLSRHGCRVCIFLLCLWPALSFSHANHRSKSSEGTKAGNCSSSWSTTKLSLQITEMQSHPFGWGCGTPFWGTECASHPRVGLQHLCCRRTRVGADPAHNTPSTGAGAQGRAANISHPGPAGPQRSVAAPGQQLRSQCLAVWSANRTQSFCCNLIFPDSFQPVGKMHLPVSW